MKLTKIEKLQELVDEYAHNEYIAWSETDELVAECLRNEGNMLFTLQQVMATSTVIFAAKTYDIDAAYQLLFEDDYTVIGIDYDPYERKAYFTEA